MPEGVRPAWIPWPAGPAPRVAPEGYDRKGGACMPEISVIVPVYRAEAFLRKCTESILAQTMGELEVLLIDDGSPRRKRRALRPDCRGGQPGTGFPQGERRGELGPEPGHGSGPGNLSVLCGRGRLAARRCAGNPVSCPAGGRRGHGGGRPQPGGDRWAPGEGTRRPPRRRLRPGGDSQGDCGPPAGRAHGQARRGAQWVCLAFSVLPGDHSRA